jgi:hypothetical protein
MWKFSICSNGDSNVKLLIIGLRVSDYPLPFPTKFRFKGIAAAGAIAASRADIVAARLLAEKLQNVVF